MPLPVFRSPASRTCRANAASRASSCPVPTAPPSSGAPLFSSRQSNCAELWGGGDAAAAAAALGAAAGAGGGGKGKGGGSALLIASLQDGGSTLLPDMPAIRWLAAIEPDLAVAAATAALAGAVAEDGVCGDSTGRAAVAVVASGHVTGSVAGTAAAEAIAAACDGFGGRGIAFRPTRATVMAAVKCSGADAAAGAAAATWCSGARMGVIIAAAVSPPIAAPVCRESCRSASAIAPAVSDCAEPPGGAYLARLPPLPGGCAEWADVGGSGGKPRSSRTTANTLGGTCAALIVDRNES